MSALPPEADVPCQPLESLLLTQSGPQEHNAKQRPDWATVAMVAADTAADNVARMSGGVIRVLYDGTIRHHLVHVFVQVESHPHRPGEIVAGQADIIEHVLTQGT